MNTRLHRRNFLQTALAAAAAPLILPRRVFGANETMNLALIGSGRMGLGDLNEALNKGMEAGARVLAVCDLDSNRVKHAQGVVDKFYQGKEGAPGPCAGYGDYKELLARKDIDGVVIATPDHWHAMPAIAAAKAGKDMYLEKPLTYTIPEGRALVKAVRDNKRILQVGSMQRSSLYQRRVCQLVRNGRIGKLKEIEVMLPPDGGTGKADPMPVPENLNYDMWLGPTATAPYTEHRVHPQKGYGRPGWLQIQQYCLGMITGWGAHMFDCAQWGHGDEFMPVDFEAKAEYPDRGLFNVHTTFESVSRFADGVVMKGGTDKTAGVKFIGESGWAYFTRGKFEASDRALLRENPDDSVQLYTSNSQMKDFLDAMRSRKDPVCSVEVGHSSNSICVLTHIAMKTGRKLQWDAAKEQFVGDDEANKLLDYPHRAPYDT